MSSLTRTIWGGKPLLVEYKDGDLVGRIFHVQEQIRKLEAQKSLSESKQVLLSKLCEDEKVLKHRLHISTERLQQKINETHEPYNLKVSKVILDLIKNVLGYLVSFASLLSFLSIIMSQFDKMLNSCKSSCRFLVRLIWNWTPIDIMLLSSQSIKFDVIFLAALWSFCLIASFHALKAKGFTIFGQKFFAIGLKRTSSDALLLTAGLQILSNFGWLYQMTLLAPQYMTYGTQSYCSLANRDCSRNPELLYSCQITSPVDQCTPTVISTMMHRTLYVLPFVGTILYYQSFAFCFAFLLGFVKSVISTKKPAETEPLL